MNKKHAALVVVAFVVVALLLYAKALDWLTTDEHRIRSIVHTIANAAEERDLWTISSYLHPNFHSEIQNMDREEALSIIGYAFSHYRVIRTRLDGLTVKIIDDTTAEARFIATVRASRSGTPPGENLLEFCGSDRFLVTLKKEDGDWLISGTEILRSTSD